MQISSRGLELIRSFEGFSPVPYRCPAGLLTIGYGHVIREHEKEILLVVTPDEAAALLMHDIARATAAVIRYIQTPLNQNQFDALASFTFNVGSGALQRSTLRRVINRGEHEFVPHQLMRWVWADGRKLTVLIRRRLAEAALYTL